MARDSLVRNINPFGLRLQPDLRQALTREARINNRSLNAEIVTRLKDSVDQPMVGRRPNVSPPMAPEYMSDGAREMLAIFNRMLPEKQLALLSLFK